LLTNKKSDFCWNGLSRWTYAKRLKFPCPYVNVYADTKTSEYVSGSLINRRTGEEMKGVRGFTSRH
jgi:hypothetical protein